MSKHKIYLSASTQEHNVGAGDYGTEEDNMFILRDRIEYYIKSGSHGDLFIIEKNNNKKSSLTDIVNESNKFKPDIHLSNHSNAGKSSVRGCEAYYSHLNKNGEGKKMATLWYKEISKVTPSSDRGVYSDSILYKSGLYELTKTISTAVLMEHFYHTSLADIGFYQKNIDRFAIATAIAVYNYFNYKYKTGQYDSYPGLKWLYKKNFIEGKNYMSKQKYFNCEQIAIIHKRIYEDILRDVKK